MKNNIKDMMKEAMKAKDKPRLETIRSLLSAIQYLEMQKNTEDLPEDQILAVIQSEIKKRKESLEFAEQGNRKDVIDQIHAEIAVLQSFMPEQLDSQKLEEVIQGIKNSQPDANLGIVMKTLKEKYAGQYDGKTASEIARRIVG